MPRARNAENANQWADRKKNRDQFGYDADVAAEGWWISEGQDQLRRLLGEKSGSDSPETATLASSSRSLGSGSKGGKKGFWRKFLGIKNSEVNAE